MSGWPIRFKNNKLDNPTDFISQSNRIQSSYQLNDADILEKLDASLQKEAYREETSIKIKFRKQKTDQEINLFIT